MDIALIVLFTGILTQDEENALLSDVAPTRNWKRLVVALDAQLTLGESQTMNVELSVLVIKS
jgi:hypothetical protein